VLQGFAYTWVEIKSLRTRHVSFVTAMLASLSLPVQFVSLHPVFIDFVFFYVEMFCKIYRFASPVLIVAECVLIVGVRDWYSFHRYVINFAYLEVNS